MRLGALCESLLPATCSWPPTFLARVHAVLNSALDFSCLRRTLNPSSQPRAASLEVHRVAAPQQARRAAARQAVACLEVPQKEHRVPLVHPLVHLAALCLTAARRTREEDSLPRKPGSCGIFCGLGSKSRSPWCQHFFLERQALAWAASGTGSPPFWISKDSFEQRPGRLAAWPPLCRHLGTWAPGLRPLLALPAHGLSGLGPWARMGSLCLCFPCASDGIGLLIVAAQHAAAPATLACLRNCIAEAHPGARLPRLSFSQGGLEVTIVTSPAPQLHCTKRLSVLSTVVPSPGGTKMPSTNPPISAFR